jgi:hypothetical protein
MAAPARAEVPRSFRLLDELAKVEGGLGAGRIDVPDVLQRPTDL